MNNNYIITEDGELYHWGVKGMRWGVRKADRLRSKASASRKMSEMYDDMSKDAEKHGASFKTRKYRNTAEMYRRRAGNLDKKVLQEEMLTPGDKVKKGAKVVSSVATFGMAAFAAGTAAIGIEMFKALLGYD